MMAWLFTFAPIPDPHVADGELRVDAASGAPVTRLYLDNLDLDGQYVRTMIAAYAPGTVIYVEGLNGTYATVRLLQAPVARVGYLELPVLTLDASPGGLQAGAVSVAFMRGAAIAAAAAPPLVTLATAKAHLYITDDDHDDRVSQKLAAASATIRDYLKDRDDPTWDDQTAPPWIVESVLLLLGHFYMHAGDEFGASNTNDQAVWAAITNLCLRSRDPALK